MDYESTAENLGEEYEGEQYIPKFACVKREVSVESESVCSEAKTTTGNILGRMICDPSHRRPPFLGKWPTYPPKSESDIQENAHQYRASQQPTPLRQMCSLRVSSEPNVFKPPAIVGTIGPACSDVGNIVELMQAGMNIARISMSHIDPCSELEPFQNVIEANNQFQTIKDYEIPIAIMMDLKGPEIRTGKIDPARLTGKSKEICLKKGTVVRLTSDKIFADRCTEKIIYVDYEGLIKHSKSDMSIYISGSQIKLTVDTIEDSSIVCTVEKAGRLGSNQKVRIPELPKALPSITNFDYECLELALKMDVDVIAVPNTRNEEVIKQMKCLLDFPDNNIITLAKISSYEGVENIDSILRFADGIIIEKNDLSLDIPPEKVFIAQKEIIGKCNRVGKPVLCTAQLTSVESSDNFSQRMEMNDIGGAIVDGADGIILISETAVGDKGVEAVTRLSNIIREAEAATMQKPFYFDLASEQIPSIEPCQAIAMAAVQIANKIEAAAILAVTTSGRTAQMLSWFRPRRPVIAITRVGKTARQMNLWRAVIPLHFSVSEELVEAVRSFFSGSILVPQRIRTGTVEPQLFHEGTSMEQQMHRQRNALQPDSPVLPDWFHDVKARFEYGVAYGKDHGIIQSGDLLVLVSGFRKGSGFTNCIRVVFASTEKVKFIDNVPGYYKEENP